VAEFWNPTGAQAENSQPGQGDKCEPSDPDLRVPDSRPNRRDLWVYSSPAHGMTRPVALHPKASIIRSAVMARRAAGLNPSIRASRSRSRASRSRYAGAPRWYKVACIRCCHPVR
jgi:hypothetical protein